MFLAAACGTGATAGSSALVFSTYLGGSGADWPQSVAVDAAGNVYVAGYAWSDDVPNATRFGSAPLGAPAAFVTKLTSAGAHVYTALISGSRGASAWAIAADAGGHAWIVGSTSSTDLPLVTPLQSELRGQGDAFLARLSPDGSQLLFSTYFGGSGEDVARAVAVGPDGSAYVAGVTDSLDLPTRSALQPLNGGGADAFVARVSSTGALVFSTYLGGGAAAAPAATLQDLLGSGAPPEPCPVGWDVANGIAVDAAGDAYVTGVTCPFDGLRGTKYSDFPLKDAAQQEPAGGEEAFVSKIASDGLRLRYSTLLGGDNHDRADAIAVDAAGRAHVAGSTRSDGLATLGAFQQERAGGSDLFVAKLSPGGSAFDYVTYVGGGASEVARGIGIAPDGRAVVAGFGTSADYPLKDPIQSQKPGAKESYNDPVVSALAADGSALAFSTYLGGTGNDGAEGLAVDVDGGIVLAGFTTWGDFPMVDAYQPTREGDHAGFVARIRPGWG